MINKFPTRLKELREQKGLSQRELAKIINVTSGTISFWETETNEPKASYIIKLTKYFKVTSDYLLGIEDEDEIWKNTKKLKNREKINIRTISKKNRI